MYYLERLENDSIYAIREVYAKRDNIAVLWSIGKDSTTLFYLIRKTFFGEVPFLSFILTPALNSNRSF